MPGASLIRGGFDGQLQIPKMNRMRRGLVDVARKAAIEPDYFWNQSNIQFNDFARSPA
jgi:hypothetical protein